MRAIFAYKVRGSKQYLEDFVELRHIACKLMKQIEIANMSKVHSKF